MAEKEKPKRKRARSFWQNFPRGFYYEGQGSASDIAALIQTFQNQTWGSSTVTVTITQHELHHLYMFKIVATQKSQKDESRVTIQGRLIALSEDEFAIDGRSSFFPGMTAVTGIAISILCPLANALFFQGAINNCWGISIILLVPSLILFWLGWSDYRECIKRFRQILSTSSSRIQRMHQEPRAPAWYELLDEVEKTKYAPLPDKRKIERHD